MDSAHTHLHSVILSLAFLRETLKPFSTILTLNPRPEFSNVANVILIGKCSEWLVSAAHCRVCPRHWQQMQIRGRLKRMGRLEDDVRLATAAPGKPNLRDGNCQTKAARTAQQGIPTPRVISLPRNQTAFIRSYFLFAIHWLSEVCNQNRGGVLNGTSDASRSDLGQKNAAIQVKFMPTKSILLAVTDPQALDDIHQVLGAGWEVTSVPDEAEALAQLDQRSFDALLVDFNLGSPDASELLNQT